MAAVTWKCPNCGGGLTFDPDSQKIVFLSLAKRSWNVLRQMRGRSRGIRPSGRKTGPGKGRLQGLPRYCTCVPAAGRRL